VGDVPQFETPPWAKGTLTPGGSPHLTTPGGLPSTDHIELQVVTSEECNILTQTHEEYIHQRKRTDMVIATMIAMHILVILMYR